MIVTDKSCLSCRRPIKGRADKKFCDDACRNNYNNRLNSDAGPLVRTINNILRKNRRILEEILPEDKKTCPVTRKRLLEKGFRFQYFTHTYTNKSGIVYYYCYDFGYRLIETEHDACLVVKEIRDLQ